jgi:hypothetical protein
VASWVVVASGMSIGHKGMLFASKSLGTTMVDLFEKEQLRIKKIFTKKGKEVWKAMLPDGPPPVPKHKYFKRINKTENDFRFYSVIFINQPTLQRNILLASLSTLDQLLPENVDILLHFIQLKNTAITRTNKLMQKENTALLFNSISIIENHSEEKVRITDADLRLNGNFLLNMRPEVKT